MMTCAMCRRCSGAAYQALPMLHHSIKPFDSKVLIIGQNPGCAKGDHLAYSAQFTSVWDKTDIEPLFHNYASFTSSSAAQRMSSVFGPQWWDLYTFTNAVRCRTPQNHIPSREMVTNCRDWTLSLLDSPQASFKLVVTMGGVARTQLGIPANAAWGELILHKSLNRIFLPIKHFVVWTAEDIKQYQEAFQIGLERIAQ